MRLLFFILSLSFLVTPLHAQNVPEKPEVWLMPPAAFDGRCLRDLFLHPDQWKETAAKIDVVAYADHLLNKQFTDAELGAWLPALEKKGLKLGLEVGAIKPWGITGDKTFAAQRPMWDRFQSLGGHIYALAMDEPLCCVRSDLKKPVGYAVEETAQFIALVRKQYPGILIGDVEPYPSIPLAELIGWIDALQTRLQQMNVTGLDFFRVDVDWVHFTVSTNAGNWTEVKKLETACRQRKLPFSLIYWAADYPHLERLKLADDATWYISVMRQGNDYALAGGSPDQYVLESWIAAPSQCVPETQEWTFTRSVRDFCNRFRASPETQGRRGKASMPNRAFPAGQRGDHEGT